MSGAKPAANCAICGRSLLVGERPLRFSPNGLEFVDVCPLCKEHALAYGWVSEGGPGLPVGAGEQRQRGLLGRLFSRPEQVEPIAEPVRRQLSRREQTIVEATHLFNISSHRRTVEGLTRSLGWPRISIISLSGTNPEVVLTVCWEISWYQYRIVLATGAVRLAQRGQEPAELEEAYLAWNAELSDAGLVTPKFPEERGT